MNPIKVIITGATGMVGEGVLFECLQNENVSEVLIVSRRHYDLQHPKLKELLDQQHEFWAVAYVDSKPYILHNGSKEGLLKKIEELQQISDSQNQILEKQIQEQKERKAELKAALKMLKIEMNNLKTRESVSLSSHK